MTTALTCLLLILSNSFMTIAWYGHLKFPNASIHRVIFISWGIAFFEYLIQVPANRIGYQTFTGYQLKVLQEAISIFVFVCFAHFWLGETITLKTGVGLGVILLGVGIVFSPA